MLGRDYLPVRNQLPSFLQAAVSMPRNRLRLPFPDDPQARRLRLRLAAVHEPPILPPAPAAHVPSGSLTRWLHIRNARLSRGSSPHPLHPELRCVRVWEGRHSEPSSLAVAVGPRIGLLPDAAFAIQQACQSA